MGMFVVFTFTVILSSSVYAKATSNKEDPGKCNSSTAGKTAIVHGRDGNQRVLICLRSNRGNYIWRELDNFPTLGEFFNPAEDCSDIVQKKRGAKSGLYWIKGFGLKRPKKVWCDVETDGGGFMLVGYKNTPISWTLPSNPRLVSPQGPPHWSSEFGNVPMLEFRIQVSTTNKFDDTKADWLYRFKKSRRLGNLLMGSRGGCTKHFPGIGHIKYVKDLLAEKVVTKNFQCSRFGPAYPSVLGWKMMNKCLKTPCRKGFAIFPGTRFRYDNFGAFSYSTHSPRSGVSHNSTVFIGCELGKCCACFNPKRATGDFCSPGCKSINGGTVSKKSHVWFWIRSSVPRDQVWNKCTEFQIQTPEGKTETRFVDDKSGVLKKGFCTKKKIPNLVAGVVKVDNEAALRKIPLVEGLLSYRKDNAKLYFTNGKSWEAIGEENMNKDLESRLHVEENQTLHILSELKSFKIGFKKRVKGLENKLNETLKRFTTEFDRKFKALEKKFNESDNKGSEYNPGQSCRDIKFNRRNAPSAIYWISPRGYNNQVFQVYCDMQTHGGGWTLVYSYTFTNYNSFQSGSNAVTPRPNWPAGYANVPISTTPPLNERSRGALDFNLWKEIGNNVLIKSNINDWIVCQPNGGSLVLAKGGSLKCQNIRAVASKCHYSPVKITWYSPGPSFDVSSHMYLFEGSTRGWWPTHDPCGSNRAYHKKGVSNPGGAIFIR